jgi:hypothetical protein
LQNSISSEETSMAKIDFEVQSKRMGIKALKYHTDNGRFADKKFIQYAQDNNQGLTYCGVNTHFQNGIA